MKTIYQNKETINNTINQVETELPNIKQAYQLISEHKQCTIITLKVLSRKFIDNEFKEQYLNILEEHGYHKDNVPFASSVWDMFNKMANKKVEYLFNAMALINDTDILDYYDIIDNDVIIKPDYKELITNKYTVTINNKALETKHTKLEQVAKLLNELNIYPYELVNYIGREYNIFHWEFMK